MAVDPIGYIFMARATAANADGVVMTVEKLLAGAIRPTGDGGSKFGFEDGSRKVIPCGNWRRKVAVAFRRSDASSPMG